jgi:uncharacterized protein (DUF2252 family)
MKQKVKRKSLESRPVNDAPPQDAPPQDAPPQDAPPQDAPPQDAPPQDAPPQDAPPQEAPTLQRDLRRQQGRQRRKGCPRSSHAEKVLGQSERDPLALLEESSRDRVEALLPIRYTRMMESPFAFFRGSAILQAHDLQGTPSAGITVQCCGDCHLLNFGGFATPERLLAFDINDLDETLPGPFEWDIKRLATSFVLAARWLGFSSGEAKRTAQASATAYRAAQLRNAEMCALEAWYHKVTFSELLERASDNVAMANKIKKEVEKASHNTSEHIFHKITTVVDGKARIADQPPLLFHGGPAQAEMEAMAAQFFADYRGSLAADRQVLFNRYQFLDIAYKVVGVGSVGTRCYAALFVDPQDEHLFLQVKEARPSVLEGRAGPSLFANQGERVVSGQHLMQSASDIFLGWARGPHGRDFYVRQLRDMKLTANLTTFTPEFLLAYARLCGETLARAHAKVGDAAMIAGYLGSATAFDEAIRNYALAYAGQVEEDYETFKQAVRAGRFPIETVPGETEQAIR